MSSRRPKQEAGTDPVIEAMLRRIPGLKRRVHRPANDSATSQGGWYG